MLQALLSDLLRIPAMKVVTTWDRRLSERLGIESEALEVIPVSGPDEERELFIRLCREADGVSVIAPELEDELSRRVAIVEACDRQRSFEPQQTTKRSPLRLNCSVEAIDLCGDKWAMFEHLTRCGILTIPTCRVGKVGGDVNFGWPRVLKLRMGAGSQSMQLVPSPDDWGAAVDRFDSSHRCSEALAQPWVRGPSLSMGVIVDRAGAVHLLPTADQWIDSRRGFAYQGGRIPSKVESLHLETLVRKTLATIPGLRGYVGVDLLLPNSWDRLPACHFPDQTRQAESLSHERATPLIVEINPRLTTSYVGYRQLCLDNLAGLWIGDGGQLSSLRWRSGPVEFNSAGEFRCGE